jgi:dTMP kinase
VRPNLTLLLDIPLTVSEARRRSRQTKLLDVPPHPDPAKAQARLHFSEPARDRMEEADRAFFERVHHGFQVIASTEPKRVRLVDATQNIETVSATVWKWVEPLL